MTTFQQHAEVLGFIPPLNDTSGAVCITFSGNTATVRTITCWQDDTTKDVSFNYTFNGIIDCITVPFVRFVELTKSDMDDIIKVIMEASASVNRHNVAIRKLNQAKQNIQLDLYIHMFRHLDPTQAAQLDNIALIDFS